MIEHMFQPALSPDLNLIEVVWSLKKKYLQAQYLEFEWGSQENKLTKCVLK